MDRPLVAVRVQLGRSAGRPGVGSRVGGCTEFGKYPVSSMSFSGDGFRIS